MSQVLEASSTPQTDVYHLNPSTGNDLTLRANRFIDHWLKTSNGTESARIAGFSGNDNVLANAASRLLRNAKVVKEINRRLGRSILTAEEVLEGLSKHARADIAEVLEPDGSFDLKSAKKRGVSGLLKKIKVKRRIEHDLAGAETEHIEHEFELHDAQAALVQLGRYHSLFIDRTQTETLNLHIHASADDRAGKLAELISRVGQRALPAGSPESESK